MILALFALPFTFNALLTPQRYNSELAPLFTSQVHYWGEDILHWAATHNMDPNFMATIMQIESCGHPTVVSSAGARGLFQVMPFHFADGEDMVDPDTNALRGGSFMELCWQHTNGNPGLTMACYNGGPGVINRSMHSWPAETQRYYQWGVGIYADARQNAANSDTLNTWLTAGGQNLCNLAALELRLR